MSEVYKLLESEIQELETITSWNEKITKMKIIKERICDEKEKLISLTNSIVKNEFTPIKISKKKSEMNLDF